jgi:hypothetical protein
MQMIHRMFLRAMLDMMSREGKMRRLVVLGAAEFRWWIQVGVKRMKAKMGVEGPIVRI